MFTETCVSYLKGLNRNRRVKQQAAGTRNNGAEVLLGAGSGIVLQLASGTAGNRWKFAKHHKRELTTHKQEKEQFIHLFICFFYSRSQDRQMPSVHSGEVWGAAFCSLGLGALALWEDKQKPL